MGICSPHLQANVDSVAFREYVQSGRFLEAKKLYEATGNNPRLLTDCDSELRQPLHLVFYFLLNGIGGFARKA